MTQMTVGQRITQQRKCLGLSQEALGEKLEVSRQAVSKWEADSAMPDVDKLIAMSRLFDVRVGWLLGVEEATESEDELTEHQLKTIEQLVSSYQQPQKKQIDLFKLLIAACTAAAVILAAAALHRVGNLPDYAWQLSHLSGSYSSLQGQLSDLSGQIEELAQGEDLLMQYDFSVKATPDFTSVQVQFQGMPRQWHEGDTGILVARLAGEEIAQAQCDFTGSSCTALLELLPADGYSYCFVLTHADGSRQQQLLDEMWYYGEYIAQGLQINCVVDISSNVKMRKVEIQHCYAYLSPPPLLEVTDGLTWTSAELIFDLNGEELKRYDLMEQKNIIGEPSLNGASLNAGFWIDDLIIPLQSGDRLSATVEARLSNHMVFAREVTAWVFNGSTVIQEIAADN